MTERMKIALAALAGAVGLGAVFFLDPARCAFFPSCPFHLLTGLYCPGCGTTRTLHQLIHGHFLAALRFNASCALLLPLLGGALALQIIRARSLAPIRGFNARPIWGWALLGLIVAFGILRNLPGEPFCWLAPHL